MRRDSWFSFALFALVMILAGAFVGGIIGEALARLVPAASVAGTRLTTIGLTPPLTLDLKVLSVTLGLSVHLNAAGVVGMLVGLVLALRR